MQVQGKILHMFKIVVQKLMVPLRAYLRFKRSSYIHAFTAFLFKRILGRYFISTISVERISGQLTCFNSSAERSLRDTEHRQRGYTVYLPIQLVYTTQYLLHTQLLGGGQNRQYTYCKNGGRNMWLGHTLCETYWS